MTQLTTEALEAWNNREKRMVLTTVDSIGMPNAIWLLCANLGDDGTLVLANNSMHKTLENIENGCSGSLLYIAPEREAYQIKGRLEQHQGGPVFDEMKQWLNPDYPGKSAILMHIEAVYYGATQVA